MSVVRQSYTNIELIIINNHSEDDSLSVIQKFATKYQNAIVIDLPETITHNKAFNLAFKKSKGDYLIDLSADDKLLTDCIEQQINFFLQQEEKVGLIFGNAKNIDHNGKFISNYFRVNNEGKVWDKDLFNTTYKRLLSGGMCMCSVSSMMKRKHFEILNGYNENLTFEDLDYWLRLSYDYKIAFLDEFLVEKRDLKGSLGNQSYKINLASKGINLSLRLIYIEAIKKNNPEENKALLKRIHYSMEQCSKNKNWNELIKFSIIELKCRFAIYFR
jgi:glycosyltransferase involved in cell wall biosynthesis